MYYTFWKKLQTKNTETNLFNLGFTQQTTYKKLTVNIQHPIKHLWLKPSKQEELTKISTAIQAAYMTLYPYKDTYQQEYYKFFIPKRNHKLREINAPNNDFKEALSKVKDIFQKQINCLPHASAYAYIPQLSTLDAIKTHQNNQSHWFLKIDLKDFFPSCKPNFVTQKLLNLYPFYYLSDKHKELLKQIIQITSLDNGMPQGSPFSPYITNLVMVEYDYEITKMLYKINKDLVYTRYADDILISSKYDFNFVTIQNEIKKILEPHFQINTEKTRYGSRAGTNWNLGLMLNKDNDITLGHIKKRTLNAMLNNFFSAYREGIPWEIPETQVLQGQLSYLKHIEEHYFEYIIKKYEKKYSANYHQILSEILNP